MTDGSQALDEASAVMDEGNCSSLVVHHHNM